jgi:hypothetical protein
MKEQSEFGILRYKFDHSGFNGNPPITDNELERLSILCVDLDSVMMDIDCKPMAYYFRNIWTDVQRMIFDRLSS